MLKDEMREKVKAINIITITRRFMIRCIKYMTEYYFVTAKINIERAIIKFKIARLDRILKKVKGM